MFLGGFITFNFSNFLLLRLVIVAPVAPNNSIVGFRNLQV